jgi:hypothetical protein
MYAYESSMMGLNIAEIQSLFFGKFFNEFFDAC